MKKSIQILIGSIILLAIAVLAVGSYIIFKQPISVSSDTDSDKNPIIQTPSAPNIPSNPNPNPKPNNICNWIALDAGSTSTEIFLYEWQCRDTVSIAKIKEVKTLEHQSGLSATVDGDQKLIKYMQDLLQKVDILFHDFGRGKKIDTPIIFAATGGVQGVFLEKKQEMFEKIFNELKNSGFLFIQAREISRSVQGAFLWMAVNFLEEKFQQEQNPGTIPLKSIVIDFDGTSTQIAFEANIISKFQFDNTILLILEKNEFNVFSKSFQDYGYDKAIEGVKVIVGDKKDKFKSGCFNKGIENITDSQIKIEGVIGQSNPEDCLKQIDKYLDINPSCETGNFECSIKRSKIHKIPAENNIVAVNEIYRVKEFFNLNDEFKPEQLLDASIEFCKLNYTEALAKKNYPENKYVPRMCFMGLYSAQLLIKGYHLDGRTIHAKELIDNQKPSWVFGFVSQQVWFLKCDDLSKDECNQSI